MNETIVLFTDVFQTTSRNLSLPSVFDNVFTKELDGDFTFN